MQAADVLSGRASAAQLLGMSPANQSMAAGQSLPVVTATAGDRQQVPWSPDSGTFWCAAIAVATVLGIAGASVRMRLGKGEASASLGKV